MTQRMRACEVRNVLSFQEKILALPLSFADRTLEGQCTVAATLVTPVTCYQLGMPMMIAKYSLKRPESNLKTGPLWFTASI